MSQAMRQWSRPQLIVLARGTPEESVLTQCKTMNPNQTAIGPNQTQQDTCAAGEVNANCSNCQARGVGAGS